MHRYPDDPISGLLTYPTCPGIRVDSRLNRLCSSLLPVAYCLSVLGSSRVLILFLPLTLFPPYVSPCLRVSVVGVRLLGSLLPTAYCLCLANEHHSCRVQKVQPP